MQFKPRNLNELGSLICGNFEASDSVFIYRISSALTEFFEDCDTDYVHDGSILVYWVADTIRDILGGPVTGANLVPAIFSTVVGQGSVRRPQ